MAEKTGIEKVTEFLKKTLHPDRKEKRRIETAPCKSESRELCLQRRKMDPRRR